MTLCENVSPKLTVSEIDEGVGQRRLLESGGALRRRQAVDAGVARVPDAAGAAAARRQQRQVHHARLVAHAVQRVVVVVRRGELLLLQLLVDAQSLHLVHLKVQKETRHSFENTQKAMLSKSRTHDGNCHRQSLRPLPSQDFTHKFHAVLRDRS